MVAERVGFEPTVQETCTPVFETGTLNHSDTSPGRLRKFNAKACIVKKVHSEGERRTSAGDRFGEGRRAVTPPPQVRQDCLAGVAAGNACDKATGPYPPTREVETL